MSGTIGIRPRQGTEDVDATSLRAGVDRVLLAAPRSFCAGVEMAIKALAWMVRIFEPPVYCYHEIVHNRLVVERFERLGVIFVDSVEEVPEGAPVMLSAHGTAPQVIERARARGAVVLDAACPLVSKVHQEVKVRASKGYTVIYAGHEGHQEAVGTMAVAPQAVRLVESAADVAALDDVEGPVAFLTQTTLSLDDWQEVLDATRKRFPDVWVPERGDLCFATTNRQSAVRKIAGRCHAMVVIGSANSSNTAALVKIARSSGCPRVLRVDGPAELPDDLAGTIGVTAGASAPEELVRAVLDRLAPVHGVEEITATEEEEYFPPPRQLRELLHRSDLTPEARAMLADDRALSAADVIATVAPSSTRGWRDSAIAVEDVLGRYVPQVEAEMAEVLDEAVDDAWLRGAISYHLGWADEEFRPLPDETARRGGKKLRPALAVLTYEAARDTNDLDFERVLPFAAALELLHNYSLIHDDIQDGDRFRRGRPTLWTICGPAQAINVGDCLHALALGSLDRLTTRGVEPARVAELIACLARTSVRLAVGQTRDIAFETESGVEPERYLEMIAHKTAALISCASYGGALLALGRSRPSAADVLGAYADFGTHLGLAFQIRDDILGIWGSEAETGKPIGRDIKRKKKTLPVVFAFRQTPPDVAQRLHSLYSQPGELSDEQEAEVREVLEAHDALGLAQRQAESHRRQALSALATAAGGSEAVQVNPFLADLVRLTDFVTRRQY